MTNSRRHSRAPLYRSTTPEKILASGLAAATCVGIVAVIGMRTIDSNAAASAETTTSEIAAPAPVAAPAADPIVAPVVATQPLAGTAAEETTTGGLSREQLDTYAASLATEKQRLDAYRTKLIKAAQRLKAQAASKTPTARSTQRRASTSRS